MRYPHIATPSAAGRGSEPSVSAGRNAAARRRVAVARRLLTAFAFGALLPLGTARAQLPELEAGTRVRIRAPSYVPGEIEGTIVSHRRDSVRINRRYGNAVSVPVSELTRLQISLGRSRPLGAVRGILWGAGAGLAVGAVASLTPNSCTESCGHEAADHFVFTPVAGALVGAGIGAVLGAERWRTVPLPAQVTVEPSRLGGVAIGFRLRN